MRTYVTRTLAILRTLLVQCIMGCLYGVRALLGSYNSCRYELNCMHYAEIQLTCQPFHRAIPAIIKRLLSCHPLRR